MKKTFTLLTTFIAFLTFFASTTFAASSGGEKEAVAASPYEGPLILLALITLAIMIYLPLTDNN
jgi:hypothetical protein